MTATPRPPRPWRPKWKHVLIGYHGNERITRPVAEVPLHLELAAAEAKFRAELAASGRAIPSRRVTPQPRRRTYPVGYTLLRRPLRPWALAKIPLRSRYTGFGSPTRSIPNDLERQRIRRAQRAARRINRPS